MTPSYEHDGVHFLDLMRHALRAPLFGGMVEPELVLVRSVEPVRQRGWIVAGYALYPEHRVELYLWEGRRWTDAASTLLHELVHLRLGYGVGHRPLFRRTFQEAAWQVYGLRVPLASCATMSQHVRRGLMSQGVLGFDEEGAGGSRVRVSE